ncbi:unnamed protein product [Orchesella dallaii]|uniref:EB domain-containing protein n=1 Tax=Orchesella dallaii TaxID=48710 RepID=A0ABP1PSB2_9HEXA
MMKFRVATILLLSFGHLTVFLINSAVSLEIQGDILIGGPCNVDDECVGMPGISSRCWDGYCTCNAGFIPSFILDDCLPIANWVGDPCEQPNQCQQGTPGALSECSNGMCTCLHEAIPSSDRRVCLPIVNTIGGYCEESQQCISGVPGYNSECLGPEKICGCKADSINEPGQHICYLKANQVGDYCQANIQCQSNLGELSLCRNSVCECMPEAVPSPDNKQCIPNNNKSRIGGVCTSSDQCSGNPTFNVECTASGMCACSLGFITSIQMDHCLPIVDYLNGPCSESQQCQLGTPGANSVCVNSTTNPAQKVCKCGSNAVNQPRNHQCYLKSMSVGSPCVIQEQCIANLEHSQCIDGVCQCIEPALRTINGAECVI